ncbi:TetR/AcrR family transcriptional regulator [Aeromicrobium sp.]|uniref:TetR/AcrR family transcriptional regulator n=1 Tax=Aeromicrobium sp. TaxID=1871063 RepID=UPI003C5F5117
MNRKPGRPRGLTVEAIAQAALDDGIGTFSMPSVARRLGVAHSGLYRYVEDRDDLLVQALDVAADRESWPEPDLPWEELLSEISETVWRMCERYPGLDRAFQQIPRPAPSVLARMEKYIESLQDQRFLSEDAAVAVEFAITLVFDCSAHMRNYAAMQAAHPDRKGLLVLKAYDIDEVWVGRGFYFRKRDIFMAGLRTRRVDS